MKKVAVLASGNGSNLQAILNAAAGGGIRNAYVALVISDRKDAYALERARQRDVPVKYFPARDYGSREEYDRALVAYLRDMEIDLVVLAGFMRLLSPVFVNAFPHRIMNIHPSLLPAFPGAHGVEDALCHGVKITGVTVHFVDEGTDTGPIVLQGAVAVYDNDTAETLRERIHKLEHGLYPKAISLWAQGRIKIEGRRCMISDK